MNYKLRGLIDYLQLDVVIGRDVKHAACRDDAKLCRLVLTVAVILEGKLAVRELVALHIAKIDLVCLLANIALCYAVLSLLKYLSVRETDHLVAIAVNEMRLVSNEKHEPVARERLEKIHNHDRVLLVEVARRLVGKDERGVLYYRSCNSNSLLLTARESRRQTLAVFLHINASERRKNSRLYLSLVSHTAKSERDCNVIVNAHSLGEVVILEYISDLEVSRAVGVGGDTLTVYQHLTRACLVKTADHIEKRSLSAPRFTEDSDHTAIGESNRNVVYGVHLICASVAVIFIQLIYLDHSLAPPFRVLRTLSLNIFLLYFLEI